MPRPAHLMMACVVALLGLGVVMVHSAALSVATADVAASTFEPELGVGGTMGIGAWVDTNLIYAGLAVGAMLLGSR
ncbi:MAG: hypothetical protein AAGL98_12310, partial [Planctomycetota bacterium]